MGIKQRKRNIVNSKKVKNEFETVKKGLNISMSYQYNNDKHNNEKPNNI